MAVKPPNFVSTGLPKNNKKLHTNLNQPKQTKIPKEKPLPIPKPKLIKPKSRK